MKKFIIFIVCLCITMIIGCEKVKQELTRSTRTIQKIERSTTVKLVTDSTGVDDGSFNASAWTGILEFYGDTWSTNNYVSEKYAVVDCGSEIEYISKITQAVVSGADLVVATGFSFDQSLQHVALNYPDQKFLIVDVDWVTLPNVMQIIFAEHEGSYIAGAAAAYTAIEQNIENPTFGFIGGEASPTITKFEIGYIQGVLSVIEDANFIDYYTDDWANPSLANEIASEWYKDGVYCIYHAAGGSGLGVIDAAKQARRDRNNVWAIGVDSDQYEYGLYSSNESAVLTSMIKKVNEGLLYALNAVENNKFRGEVVVLDLKAGGVDISSRNSVLSNETRAQLEFIKNRISFGDIKVISTYKEAKLLPNFPQNLLAID